MGGKKERGEFMEQCWQGQVLGLDPRWEDRLAQPPDEGCCPKQNDKVCSKHAVRCCVSTCRQALERKGEWEKKKKRKSQEATGSWWILIRVRSFLQREEKKNHWPLSTRKLLLSCTLCGRPFPKRHCRTFRTQLGLISIYEGHQSSVSNQESISVPQATKVSM